MSEQPANDVNPEQDDPQIGQQGGPQGGPQGGQQGVPQGAGASAPEPAPAPAPAPEPAPAPAPAPNVDTGITGLSTINPAAVDKSAQQERRQRVAQEAKGGWWWGTGRRKRAVARVRLRPAKDGAGSLRVQVSGKKMKDYKEYFCLDRDREDCVAPLRVTDTLGKLDVVTRANGGGVMGQAQAVRLGIARALIAYDPSFEETLRDNGFLTRDAREVERKKYGQAGARRRFQFSKR